MVIKKYIAKTEEDAIRMAKEELGKDTVIMNVKKTEPKGIYRLFRKESVEVTAAIDEVLPEQKEEGDDSFPDFDKLQQAIKSQEFQPAPDSKQAVAQAKKEEIIVKNNLIREEDSKEEAFEEANIIEQKLDNLQDLLKKQMNAPEEEKETEKEQDKTQSYLQLIRSQMIQNEVDPAYVEQIIEDIEGSLKKESSLDNILSGVYQKIVLKIGPPQLIDIHSKRTKFIFFIGPTGVGKTTTIAKIASTLKLSRKVKVALVTSDTYRIAAVEQLKTYANILGIPLKVVYSSDEMGKTMEELEEFDLVLIDTAGRSHNNQEQKEDIQHLLEMVPETEREVFLVLSATTKYKDLVKISKSYSEITKYNLIFTKLDETDAIGNVLNIRMLTGAPLSYMTWGQNVPDDIGKADAQKMAKQLLGGNS
ncbi:MAG: flagellar biosynthesis protein FlhF [Lachnospiraceae bacterium]|nr:flagellar biosynthesis protein FlhF [Lachnospiraceae bacterium]